MRPTRHRVLTILTGFLTGLNYYLSKTLGDLTMMDNTINLRDNSRLLWPTGLEELHNTRQASSDVGGLGGLTGNLGKNVTRVYTGTIGHHDVGPGR